MMKKEYDFASGRRGSVVRPAPGKDRITIRLDRDILDWFRDQCHAAGGGSYQTMINEALRRFIETSYEQLEDTVRRVVREELTDYGTDSLSGKEDAFDGPIEAGQPDSDR